MEVFFRRLLVELGIKSSEDEPGPISYLYGAAIFLGIALAFFWWLTN